MASLRTTSFFFGDLSLFVLITFVHGPILLVQLSLILTSDLRRREVGRGLLRSATSSGLRAHAEQPNQAQFQIRTLPSSLADDQRFGPSVREAEPSEPPRVGRAER